VTRKKKPGPVPHSKKPPPKPAPINAKKRTAEEALDGVYFKVKKRRTNWGEDPAKVKLDAAIKEWEGRKGQCAPDRSGGPLTLREFSTLCNIPYDTFKKYVANSNKRRVSGRSVGRAPLVGKQDQRFLADVMARKDRANDGANPSEAIDLVQELALSLLQEQARRPLKRTLIPHHPEQVKHNPVVAQATTRTKRSTITLEQQFCWHTTYEGALNELRERNMGKCRLTGKTYGELIQYFISGGDETCFMAREEGNCQTD
jgi:hypothetical protein